MDEQFEIDELANQSEDVRDFLKFDSDEWLKLNNKADNPSDIRTAAIYLYNLITRAVEAEKILVSDMKKVNEWYIKNRGYHYFERPEEPNAIGYLSYIYSTNSDNPINSYIYDDMEVKREIIEYLLDNQMIYHIGRIEHQGELREAWTIK